MQTRLWPAISQALILSLTCLLLASCAAPTEAEIGPPPVDYKETIKSYIHANFFDPYSMRDVRISEPHAGRWNFIPGWRVCVSLNAKNRMGGYTGISETSFFFYRNIGEEAVQLRVDIETDVCRYATYSPWPDLDSGTSILK